MNDFECLCVGCYRRERVKAERAFGFLWLHVECYGKTPVLERPVATNTTLPLTLRVWVMGLHERVRTEQLQHQHDVVSIDPGEGQAVQ